MKFEFSTLEKKIKINFRNKDLLIKSLTHKSFDKENNYTSKSFLSVPLMDHQQNVIGVMQLINARDSFSQKITAFAPRLEPIITALASYAAITLENEMLNHVPPPQSTRLAKPA